MVSEPGSNPSFPAFTLGGLGQGTSSSEPAASVPGKRQDGGRAWESSPVPGRDTEPKVRCLFLPCPRAEREPSQGSRKCGSIHFLLPTLTCDGGKKQARKVQEIGVGTLRSATCCFTGLQAAWGRGAGGCWAAATPEDIKHRPSQFLGFSQGDICLIRSWLRGLLGGRALQRHQGKQPQAS